MGGSSGTGSRLARQLPDSRPPATKRSRCVMSTLARPLQFSRSLPGLPDGNDIRAWRYCPPLRSCGAPKAGEIGVTATSAPEMIAVARIKRFMYPDLRGVGPRSRHPATADVAGPAHVAKM